MPETDQSRSLFDRLRPFLPAVLFLIAFGFRLIGIGWGLPNDLHNQSYHPDEQIIWSMSTRVKPAELDFTPGVYNYGTLYLTLLRVASDVVKGYGGGPKADEKSLWDFIGRCNLAGRYISAFAGATTSVLLFLMMRRFTRVLGAFAAGLFVAVAPAFVVHSRFQTTDVLATCLLAASTYYALKLLPRTSSSPGSEDKTGLLRQREALTAVVLSGLFAGLSGGTKYTGILAIFTLMAVLWMTNSKESGRNVLIGLLSTLVGFFVATPGALLDYKNFAKSFLYEIQHTSTGHGLLFAGVTNGYLYHVENLVQGVGPFLLLFSFAAVVFACVKRQRWVVALLVFAVPYFLLIGHAEVLFLRYTFPLYIVLAAAFGWWVGEAHHHKGRHTAVVILGILALGSAARLSAIFTSVMAASDSRDEAALELRQITADRNNAVVGYVSDPWYYSPPLAPDMAIMRGLSSMERIWAEMAQSKPRSIQYLPPNPQERFDWDSRLITETKPDYIVFSSFEVGDVSRLVNAAGLAPDQQIQVDRFKSFEPLLEAKYNQIQPTTVRDPQKRYEEASLLVHDLEYIRPIIWIWKRKDLP